MRHVNLTSSNIHAPSASSDAPEYQTSKDIVRSIMEFTIRTHPTYLMFMPVLVWSSGTVLESGSHPGTLQGAP